MRNLLSDLNNKYLPANYSDMRHIRSMTSALPLASALVSKL